MKFNGKDLQTKHVTALEEAVKIHNQHNKNLNPSFTEITAEQYLEELMLRQLEGIVTGVGSYKEMENLQQRRLEETRRRLGIF